MQQTPTQARILAQIERMAADKEDPTNDVHAWLETQLHRDPEIATKLTPHALQWLRQHGLLQGETAEDGDKDI